MKNPTAKIVRFHQTGNASVLQLDDVPMMEPKAHEVRIKVEAIGLNRAEVMFREGHYLENPKLPSKLGYEASGKIDAFGENVTEFQIGDKVSSIPAFSMSEYGVYGESAIVPAAAVAKYPNTLSAIEGTSIWMQYITAFGALFEIAHLKKRQAVLITAASSSVGIAAIQIAKSVGALTIATTRGADKKPFLLQTGADHVIATDDDDLNESIKSLAGESGVDIIFDPIGGPLLEQLANVAAPGAIIIEYGALDTAPTPFPLFQALGKGLTLRGYTMFEIVKDPEALERAKTFLYAGLQSGELKPIIDRTFPLHEIVQAHEYMESNQQKGKIVVTV